MGAAVSSEPIDVFEYKTPEPIPDIFADLLFPSLDNVSRFLQCEVQTLQEDTEKTQSLSNYLDKSYFQSYVHNLGAFYGYMQHGGRQGVGIQLYREKVFFFGNFDQDEVKGEGLALFNDNSFYYGLWNEKELFGSKGMLFDKNGFLYIGQFNQKQIVFGQVDKGTYEYFGNFKNGMRDGIGKCQFEDGCIYDGEWSKDQMQGVGIMQYYNKKQYYYGQFKKNVREGVGIQQEETQEYIGEFQNDKFNGLGCKSMRLQHNNEIQFIEGIFCDGVAINLYVQYSNLVTTEKQWYFRKTPQSDVEKVQNVSKKMEILKIHTFKHKEINNFEQLRNSIVNQQQQLSIKVKQTLQMTDYYRNLLIDYKKEIAKWIPILGIQIH